MEFAAELDGAAGATFVVGPLSFPQGANSPEQDPGTELASAQTRNTRGQPGRAAGARRGSGGLLFLSVGRVLIADGTSFQAPQPGRSTTCR
jgi:hypothetical protein